MGKFKITTTLNKPKVPQDPIYKVYNLLGAYHVFSNKLSNVVIVFSEKSDNSALCYNLNEVSEFLRNEEKYSI